MHEPFEFRPGKSISPILLSSPHSGTSFDEDASLFHETIVKQPTDTDWYVDELYTDAYELGIAVISASYSRYVVDLNRPRDSVALYSDGRSETGLFPQKSFNGEALYKDVGTLTKDVKERRIEEIYNPYYEKIRTELELRYQTFGYALLFDAHSIKSVVRSIQDERFPHFIIGTNSGNSCPSFVEECALSSLRNWQDYKVAANAPFRGGHITRHFGGSDSHYWAIQLEMTQDLYLDEASNQLVKEKSSRLSSVLNKLLKDLQECLRERN